MTFSFAAEDMGENDRGGDPAIGDDEVEVDSDAGKSCESC
jgi:hypothetical protein